MRVKRLIIKNIGMIGKTTIELNKPLILFYGEIMQGKTTILNSVKWCFGGNFPSDIIKHGEDEASVTLEFEGGSISREWYVGKDNVINSRPIVFIRDGKSVKKPVDEIKKFLNPFLLDQDYLRKMTELERKQYFTQLFAVDTSEIDREYIKAESEAKELRAKIKGYGEIDLTEVKPIDVGPLKEKLSAVRENYKADVQNIEKENSKIRTHNFTVDKTLDHGEKILQEIERIKSQITELQDELTKTLAAGSEIHEWIKENPHKKEFALPESPDTSWLEENINEAAANEVRVEQYKKNLKRAEDKATDEAELESLESTQRKLKRDKIAKLSKISESCGIKNLSFDETGNFIYEETTAGMLSGSQIMKLSSELSALYPEGLGIDLIDRGESLGKSIFLFVDRAEREKKTILATIVGEKPAIVPERIGVYVVEKGEVKS